MDSAIKERTRSKLSTEEACILDWLWDQNVLEAPGDDSNYIPKYRQPCEGVELFFNRSSGHFQKIGHPLGDTSPGCILHSKCNLGTMRNMCSLYLDAERGWLESEQSFQNTRSALKSVTSGNVEYRHWTTETSLDVLYGNDKPKGDVFMYLTNVIIPPSRWKALLERWGEQSLGTIKTARIINSVKWKITRIEPTFGEGLSSGGEVFAQCSPGKCTDAHNCAWDAVSYFMPGKGDVIEVVRRPLWGFKLDSEFGPKAYAGLETFLNYTTKEMKDKRILFHILVGEGVSRERLLNAFKHSLKHQAAEVWILESTIEKTSHGLTRSHGLGFMEKFVKREALCTALQNSKLSHHKWEIKIAYGSSYALVAILPRVKLAKQLITEICSSEAGACRIQGAELLQAYTLHILHP